MLSVFLRCRNNLLACNHLLILLIPFFSLALLDEPFSVKVGVHQGSVLSPLLFITVLEALSQEFRTGCPCELLYADDLVS